MELQGLQEQLKALESERERISQQGLDTSFQDATIRDVKAHITELEGRQQAHEVRVHEATVVITERLDTLYLGGQTLRELCADEEAYQILRISFTQDYISQATKNSEVLSQVQAEAQTAIKQANDRASELDNQNTELLKEKHKLSMELEDITSRFKAVELLLSEAPSSEETEKLKQEIADLKAQLELKAKAEEPKGDAKSQIDAMVEARENKKVKITNLRLADPSGINTKDYLATDVLTGLEINIHSNYVKSYKEVSAEEAEQIRADEANKKAELEQQAAAIPTLGTPDIDYVNDVMETDEAATDVPFQIPTADSQGDPSLERNESLDESVGPNEESEVVTRAEHEALKLNLGAVSDELESVKKFIGMAA